MADGRDDGAPALPAVSAEPVDALARLEAAINAVGSASAWAASAGVSPAYVSDVRLGRGAPGRAILGALGLERRVSYAPVVSEVRS